MTTKHFAKACDAVDEAYWSRKPTSYLRQRRRSVSHDPNAVWARYEREKQAWIDANPAATPEEYHAAMSRIAKDCGA
ncbi:MAG: hypothetical protein M0Z99_32155 [Betaproteobacteria bacterium]|nr:hypothetical protein [Betaproteobacteria bacterium]